MATQVWFIKVETGFNTAPQPLTMFFEPKGTSTAHRLEHLLGWLESRGHIVSEILPLTAGWLESAKSTTGLLTAAGASITSGLLVVSSGNSRLNENPWDQYTAPSE